MYACDYSHAAVLAGDGEVFARSPAGSADGLAVDEQGGVWVATGEAGAIARFAADGSLDRTVDVPAEFVSSLCFGGDDLRDVYVTTIGALFRGRCDVPGPAPHTRPGVCPVQRDPHPFGSVHFVCGLPLCHRPGAPGVRRLARPRARLPAWLLAFDMSQGLRCLAVQRPAAGRAPRPGRRRPAVRARLRAAGRSPVRPRRAAVRVLRRPGVHRIPFARAAVTATSWCWPT